MPPGDLDLKFFDAWILEFDNLATGNTDQMIVVLILPACFITCLTITKMSLLGNTALGKKFQSAVNRCVTDSRVFPPQAEIKILSRKM